MEIFDHDITSKGFSRSRQRVDNEVEYSRINNSINGIGVEDKENIIGINDEPSLLMTDIYNPDNSLSNYMSGNGEYLVSHNNYIDIYDPIYNSMYRSKNLYDDELNKSIENDLDNKSMNTKRFFGNRNDIGDLIVELNNSNTDDVLYDRNTSFEFSKLPVFNNSSYNSISYNKKNEFDQVRDDSIDSMEFSHPLLLNNNNNDNNTNQYFIHNSASGSNLNINNSSSYLPLDSKMSLDGILDYSRTAEGYDVFSTDYNSTSPFCLDELDYNNRHGSSALSATPNLEWNDTTSSNNFKNLNYNDNSSGSSIRNNYINPNIDGNNMNNIKIMKQLRDEKYNLAKRVGESGERNKVIDFMSGGKIQDSVGVGSNFENEQDFIKKGRTLKDALAEDFKTMEYITSLTNSNIHNPKTKKPRSPLDSPVQIYSPKSKIPPGTPDNGEYYGDDIRIDGISSVTPENPRISTKLEFLHKQLIELLKSVALIPVDDATSNNEADSREVRLNSATQFGLTPLRETQYKYLTKPLKELGTIQGILEGFEEEPFVMIPAPRPALVLRGIFNVLDAMVETIEGNKDADIEVYINNLEGVEGHAAKNATLFVMQSPSSQSSRYTRSAESITETVISMVAQTPLCRDDLSKSSGYDRRRLSSILAPLKAMGAIREVQFEKDKSLSVSIQFLRSEDNIPIPVVNGERFFGQRLSWCPAFRRFSMNVNGYTRYLEHLKRANRVVSSRLFAIITTLLQRMAREGRQMYEDEVTRFPEELSSSIEQNVLLRLRRYNGYK